MSLILFDACEKENFAAARKATRTKAIQIFYCEKLTCRFFLTARVFHCDLEWRRMKAKWLLIIILITVHMLVH